MARLTLKNGQWLDVKDRLRVIDSRLVHTHSVDGVSSDGKTYRFNVVKHQIATAAVRIKHWTVKDESDKHIVWPTGSIKDIFSDRVDVIETLDTEVFDEINKLITEHFKETEAEEEEEKKETPDGGTPSTTSSSSVN